MSQSDRQGFDGKTNLKQIRPQRFRLTKEAYIHANPTPPGTNCTCGIYSIEAKCGHAYRTRWVDCDGRRAIANRRLCDGAARPQPKYRIPDYRVMANCKRCRRAEAVARSQGNKDHAVEKQKPVARNTVVEPEEVEDEKVGQDGNYARDAEAGPEGKGIDEHG